MGQAHHFLRVREQTDPPGPADGPQVRPLASVLVVSGATVRHGVVLTGAITDHYSKHTLERKGRVAKIERSAERDPGVHRRRGRRFVRADADVGRRTGLVN